MGGNLRPVGDNRYQSSDDIFKDLNIRTPPAPALIHLESMLPGKYSVITGKYFDVGVRNLKAAYADGCEHPTIKIDDAFFPCPLTFKETLEYRVNDFASKHSADGKERSDDRRVALFREFYTTSSAVIYKKGSAKFKIVSPCSHLIVKKKLSYAKAQGVELRSDVGLYNVPLSKSQVLDHPAWIAAVEGDKHLLEDYCDIVFSFWKSEALSVWVETSPRREVLRPMVLDGLQTYSDMICIDDLDSFVRFLFVKKRPELEVKNDETEV